MKKYFIPIAALLIILGVGFRAVELLSGNYLFGFDQGRDYMAAYSIVAQQKFTLIGAEVGAGSAGLTNLFHGPGHYYLMSLMYVLFRGDPYGGIVLMFLFGFGALILSYLTAKKMFGDVYALFVLFLVAVSPRIAPQSRFVWNSHPTSLFIVVAFYFAYMISKKPRLFAPLAIFVAGLIYHFELAIAVPLVLALYLALPLVYRIKDVRTYIYTVCAGLFAFAPMIMFEMRHGWKAVSSLWQYMLHGNAGFGTIFVLRFLDHAQSYINNAKDSFIIEHGFIPTGVYKILGLVLFAAIPVLAVSSKDKMKRKFFCFLFLTLCVSYAVLLLLNNTIWDYYLIHAHFIFIYVFAYVATMGIVYKPKTYIYKGATILLFIFFLSMGIASYRRLVSNWQYDFSDFGGVEKIVGKKQAVDYIYRDAGGAPFSVFTFMAPIYTYPYDYLFKTYGKDTYGYEPGNEKKGLVYLLIEPDNSKPWTYKGWLETVIVGGDIIRTTTLSTGHIIQVRQFP